MASWNRESLRARRGIMARASVVAAFTSCTHSSHSSCVFVGAQRRERGRERGRVRERESGGGGSGRQGERHSSLLFCFLVQYAAAGPQIKYLGASSEAVRAT